MDKKIIHEKLEEIVVRNDESVRTIIAKAILELTKIKTNIIINDIANASFTSISSVTKFCKSLGFTGWKEFYILFRSEGENEQNKYNQEMTLTDEKIKNLLAKHKILVSEVLSSNQTAIVELRDLFASVAKIYIIGEQNYYALLLNFYHQLIISSYDSYLTCLNFIAKKFFERLQPDDLIILFVLDHNSNYLINLIKLKIEEFSFKNIKIITKANTVDKIKDIITTTPILINDKQKIYTHQTIYESLLIILNSMINIIED
ncbi:MurR/RpiR family transcriptional regulator [Spiroplasma chrysopicola]|uniref:Putative RpiR family transcriptional regulator n=1 Tax=Spiroplasma chrysopicola DF-1 TaxID=1276227 RepID=R4UBC8_9MOLU|nr:RpiR family transcriptional regulator [Spiroplasma chrysopicola]AGM25189.1 putative RpiR family transcriptional regulator [Spiroplasma chrysopicola DF-1]